MKLLFTISLSLFSLASYATSYECTAKLDAAFFDECYELVKLKFSSSFDKLSFSAPMCDLNETSKRDTSYKPRSKEKKGAYKYKQVQYGSGCDMNAIVLKPMVSKAKNVKLILEQTRNCGEYVAFNYECVRTK